MADLEAIPPALLMNDQVSQSSCQSDKTHKPTKKERETGRHIKHTSQ
jgi:hypothetical protein